MQWVFVMFATATGQVDLGDVEGPFSAGIASL